MQINTLTWQDIDRIGELFNICQDKLEREHPEYGDWGTPSDILAKEVLKTFNEEKQNNENTNHTPNRSID